MEGRGTTDPYIGGRGGYKKIITAVVLSLYAIHGPIGNKGT
jgi:hypothetical protein